LANQNPPLHPIIWHIHPLTKPQLEDKPKIEQNPPLIHGSQEPNKTGAGSIKILRVPGEGSTIAVG
jgi:hypothetical protein